MHPILCLMRDVVLSNLIATLPNTEAGSQARLASASNKHPQAEQNASIKNNFSLDSAEKSVS
jgi:hypothetical protein